MSGIHYWLCCGSHNFFQHANGCVEANIGHPELCRWGTANEHSEWQLERVISTKPPDGNGADRGPTKPSNPKDIIGSRKLDLMCVPWTAIIGLAKALWEGVVKYGRFNWRLCGVRASIYISACKRHMAKWENGQDADPKTRIHHLDSAMACLAIMRDAEVFGKLEDDRPPCPDPDAVARLIDEQEGFGPALREVFKDHDPYQYTINDTRILRNE